MTRYGPAQPIRRSAPTQHEHGPVGLHERLHEHERDQCRRDGGHEVRATLGHEAGRPPHRADRGDEHAGSDARESREQHDRQCRSRASEHQAEQIPAQHIRSEGEDRARVIRPGIGAVFDDEIERLVRREALPDKRGGQEREQRDERGDRQQVRETRAERRP